MIRESRYDAISRQLLVTVAVVCLAGFLIAGMGLLKGFATPEGNASVGLAAPWEGVAAFMSSFLSLAAATTFIVLLIRAWPRNAVVSVALMIFAATGVVAPVVAPAGEFARWYDLVAAMLLMGCGVSALFVRGIRGWTRVAVFTIALALVFGRSYLFLPLLLPGIEPAVPTWMLGASEWLVILGTVFAFFAWGWKRVSSSRPLIYVAGIAALLLAMFLATQAYPAASTAMWSLGVTLRLPWSAYTLPFFLYVFTALATLKDRGQMGVGAALVLFPLAGHTPAMTHQDIIAILAATVLVWPKLAAPRSEAAEKINA